MAEVHLAMGSASAEARDFEAAVTHFDLLLAGYSDTPAAGKAAGSMRSVLFSPSLPAAKAFALLEQARKAAKEPKDVVAAEQLAHIWHQAQAAQALKTWGAAVGDDPEDLNLVAWTAFLQQMTPKPAQEWARRAVDLSDRDPAILDTLANLLHLARKYDEAITLEEEAVAKAVDPGMKLELGTNLAMWKAAREVRQAQGKGKPPVAPPATPPEAPAPVDPK
jgi:tetratricopeptide (TPR) repeat protein